MRDEIQLSLSNLSCLASGLADACMVGHLFGAETQQVITACDELRGESDPQCKVTPATALNDYKALWRMLKAELDEPPRNWDQVTIIAAFECAMKREIEILEQVLQEA